ncbi:hypothetical protein I4U23_016542 [Adineta vaga]|nr:hypothetical protein I4U23_016542 [Adineta vaga]
MDTTDPEPSAPPYTLNADYIPPKIDADTQSRANMEQQNEIIALNDIDGTWKLDLGHAFYKQWRDIQETLTIAIEKNEKQNLISHYNLPIHSSSCYQEDKVFVVSLLGNTSSGKSFVARHLLCESSYDYNNNGPVCIDETEKKGATTGNVNCYGSKSNNNIKTLILDYEGEKGSGFPLLLYARRGWERLTRTAEKAKQRRQAVTDYFPKLAYILSDVVILLGNEDLASTDYLTRCHEFALKANDGVSQIPYRPVLVIIQNKCSVVKSLALDDVTKNFFDIHGQEAMTLQDYFSEIKCFCLPHSELLQRTRIGTILDGRQIFDQQIVELKQLIGVVGDRNSHRLLTHAQWLYLLHRVLEIVHSGKSVSLHTLLGEIVGQNNGDSIDIAMNSFLLFYNEKSVHTPDWFITCRRFAMNVLGHCLAVMSLYHRELISERIIREQCKKALKLLFDKLDEFQPCKAVYSGKGRSSQKGDSESPVFCYQHKGAHTGGHRTSISVYGLTPWQQFWNISSTDVWYGAFVGSEISNEISNAVLFEDEVNYLSRTVKELMTSFEANLEDIYTKFTYLFRYCKNQNPTRIFRDVCFCVENNSPISSIMHNLQTVPIVEQKQQLMDILKRRLLRILSLIDSSSSFKCKICYEKLVDPSTKTDLTSSERFLHKSNHRNDS